MKKKKYIVSIMMILILLATSIGTYLFYPNIQKAVDRNGHDHWYINDFMADKIADYNYVIDFENKSKNNTNFQMSEYMEVLGESQIDQLKEDQSSFEYHIKQKQRELKDEQDIYYQAIDSTTHQKTSNTDDDLNSLKDNKELQEKYQWYIQIQFDKDRQLFINFSSDEQLENVSHYQSYMPNDDRYHNDNGELISTLKYKSPQNITITYAVPKTLVAGSDLNLYLTNPNNNNYLQYASPYVLTFIALITFIVLFTPLQLLADNKLLRFVTNIKFEILSLLWCSITLTLYITSQYLIAATSQNLMIKLYQEFAIEKAAGLLTPLINIGYWFIFYALFLIFAYLIKYLFDKGFKRYFKENTCLGWIVVNSHKLFNKVINFDLNDNINRSVLKIVIVNFFIISLISIFFVFGFFFAFIYSVVIFFLLKNKFSEIKQDYEVLLNATKRLSNGQFDVNIHEDVGVFNPLKNEFAHIKDGFEKAVKEEVKSQKMKTELISNVSHDLKTPLTSIITYVDLLKKDQLTDEERNQYIQVLERNSLRLKNLIDDLFEVSKANSGDIKLNFVDVDIVSLIKQAELECQDKLDEKMLNIRLSTSHDKIIHSLDSSKTYRIFENLFINISKYALENTRVYIDVIDDNEKITIVFKNISEQEINFNEKEIVERFVQGDKSRNTTGSGLGLAIVKSFTELQKGEFHVETDGDLFKSVIIFHK